MVRKFRGCGKFVPSLIAVAKVSETVIDEQIASETAQVAAGNAENPHDGRPSDRKRS